MCAAHGLDLRAPLQPGTGSAAALATVRGRIAAPGPDRWLAPDLAAAEDLVRTGAVLDAVEAAVGPLD
jgi:histidine ammonia-lyase